MPEEKISFIPKKNGANSLLYKTKGPGILIISSSLIVFVSVFLFGGAVLYKNNLEKQINVLNESLAKIQTALEPATIAELIGEAERINISKELLNNHQTLLPVFKFLENNTLKKIQLKNFKYNVNKDGEPEVSLQGISDGYVSLALQSDVFKNSKELKSFGISGMSLEDKGIVNFSADLIFNSSFLTYKME